MDKAAPVVCNGAVLTGFPTIDAALAPVSAGCCVWKIPDAAAWRDLEPHLHRAAAAAGRAVRSVTWENAAQGGDAVPLDSLWDAVDRVRDLLRDARGGAVLFWPLPAGDPLAFPPAHRALLWERIACWLAEWGIVGHLAVRKSDDTYALDHPVEERAVFVADLFACDGAAWILPKKLPTGSDDAALALFRVRGDDAEPVRDSATAARVATREPWCGLLTASFRTVSPWDQRFLYAEEMVRWHADDAVRAHYADLAFPALFPPGSPALTTPVLRLEDAVYAWKRTIGSGRIGGKAAGLVWADRVLGRDDPVRDPLDAFFVGSDVFVRFLHDNDAWPLDVPTDPEDFAAWSRPLVQRIRAGRFRPAVRTRLLDLLDYFGDAPLVVRSSSAREDGPHPFAGVYATVFVAPKGDRAARAAALERAIARVYASALEPAALRYCHGRGLPPARDAMAVIVHRLCGRRRGALFAPDVAGVAASSDDLALPAGDRAMARMVCGLGTGAVQPGRAALVPLAKGAAVRTAAADALDVLDLERGAVQTMSLRDVLRAAPDFPVGTLAAAPPGTPSYALLHPETVPWRADLHGVLPWLRPALRDAVRALADAAHTDVEIEFAACVAGPNRGTWSLLQCRPLPAPAADGADGPVPGTPVLTVADQLMGPPRRCAPKAVIAVDPERYFALPPAVQVEAARRIESVLAACPPGGAVLIGPGRFGSAMPSLGVPLSAAYLNRLAALVEWNPPGRPPIPGSWGTHFLHELAAAAAVYAAAEGPDAFRWSVFARLAAPLDATSAGSCVLVARSAVRWHLAVTRTPRTLTLACEEIC